MSVASSEDQLAVNGKVDLGTRQLKVSHVENACSFYAYLESESTMMADILTAVTGECRKLARLESEARPGVGEMLGMFEERSKDWYRVRVEQELKKGQVRVRLVDFGSGCVAKISSLVQLPPVLSNMKVRCEKYKMADIKPKGRAEGFSAADRLSGAEWLERTISGRTVLATCHRQVRYEGGIMVDCMVGSTNLNQAVLRQGLAVRKTEASFRQRPRQQLASQFDVGMRGYQVQETGMMEDLDYISYTGGKVERTHLSSRNDTFRGCKEAHFKGKEAHFKSKEAPNKGKETFMKIKEAHTKSKDLHIKGEPSHTKSKEENFKKVSVKTVKIDPQPKPDQVLGEIVKATTVLPQSLGLEERLSNLQLSLGQVREGRGDGVGERALQGVAAVIEGGAAVTEPLMLGSEAVEAAVRKVKSQVLEQRRGTLLQDLLRCINSYLLVYQEQVVVEWHTKVSDQLTKMTPTIPSSWKLLAVRADKVTRENLVEVATNVRNWEASSPDTSSLSSITDREVDNLAVALEQTARELRGEPREPPLNLDTMVRVAQGAVEAELKQSEVTSKSSRDSSSVVRSSWRALTALQAQLESCRVKRAEYSNMITALGLHSA